MMRQRLLAAIVGIPSFFALLFGIGAGHALLTSSAMAAMGEQMTQNQCQSSCLSQTNVIASERKIEIDDKDIKPQPTKPYYLAFMGVGWSIVLLVSAYLLRHLHWRPPDIVKLTAAYRF